MSYLGIRKYLTVEKAAFAGYMKLEEFKALRDAVDRHKCGNSYINILANTDYKEKEKNLPTYT